MGMRYDGLICSSCKMLIEGNDFIRCTACQGVIHRNEHCEQIHRMSCPGRRLTRQPDPELGLRPNIKDIFK